MQKPGLEEGPGLWFVLRMRVRDDSPLSPTTEAAVPGRGEEQKTHRYFAGLASSASMA